MTREEAIAIIENEKKCVNRANKNDYCNRDCYNCELVKTDIEILTALDMAIKALSYDDTKYYEGHGEVVVDKAVWEDAKGALEQEPKYCDRNICLRNEYNNIGCDECEVTKSQEPKTDVLDKIKAEILLRDENVKDVRTDGHCFFTAEEILEIIDKHMAESEDKPKTEKVFKMRDATSEEQEAVDKYIKSISKPTGINIFDFYENREKNCLNCKHQDFICEVKGCKDYKKWEQADGKYISRQAVINCFKKWQPYMATRLHEFEKELSELPSVAIPSAEPKTGHWITDVDKWGDIVTTVNGYRCDKCNAFNSDKDNYCPNCGAKMN